jgi:hypothetical protein
MATVGIRSDGTKEEETQGRRLDEIGPQLPQKHTHKQDGKDWANLPAFQQSKAWVLYMLSQSL